jgi:hypothetical protein
MTSSDPASNRTERQQSVATQNAIRVNVLTGCRLSKVFQEQDPWMVPQGYRTSRVVYRPIHLPALAV